jgi:hypothetical protein
LPICGLDSFLPLALVIGVLTVAGACGGPGKGGPGKAPPSTVSSNDLSLKWGQRLNISAPGSTGATGVSGERLLPVEAEIVSMTIPLEKAASLQADRAKVTLRVTRLPDNAPRRIEYIDLWCPDSLIRERAWQVGSKVIVRLAPEYALYDVAEHR